MQNQAASSLLENSLITKHQFINHMLTAKWERHGKIQTFSRRQDILHVAEEFMRQPLSEERRRHERFPVTVSARVQYADILYRTEILDVSTGGMLLAPIDALIFSDHKNILIECAVFGKIEALVVSQSNAGIHVAADLSPTEFQNAIERLFELSRAWAPA